MSFFAAHRDLLERAVAACRARTYWSAYPESASGKIYGETAKADGEAAFKAMLGKPFELDQPSDKRAGKEVSPYGMALGITYPTAAAATLIAASQRAGRGWAAASIEDRVGVCLEILQRVNRQSFLMANAVMHTTGQSFMMAFQAGGPHAQDRGLEAVAYAYDEMTRVPGAAEWAKPQGKGEPIVLDKQWRVVPRGVALVIGCATFPTWNSYPALFASLATGNSVIVKPHPGAILPLAITIRIAREVMKEAGFDPNVRAARRGRGRRADRPRTSSPIPPSPSSTSPAAPRSAPGCAKHAAADRRLHRGGRHQPDRHQLDQRLPRHVRQHRLLAVALFGPDVHRAAEHLRAGRRHRHR